MKSLKILILGMLTLIAEQNIAEEIYLKNPLLRDEDISRTIISANYKILPSGLYEYTYDIKSPKNNKGIISGFFLDIACDSDFGIFAYDEPAAEYFKNYSNSGLHVPVQGYGVMLHTGYVSVTGNNEMY